jgi:hypothetical protein
MTATKQFSYNLYSPYKSKQWMIQEDFFQELGHSSLEIKRCSNNLYGQSQCILFKIDDTIFMVSAEWRPDNTKSYFLL